MAKYRAGLRQVERDHHSTQIGTLAETEADMVTGITMTCGTDLRHVEQIAMTSVRPG